MNQGTVKWFDAEKGYGIVVLDNGEDVFVHFSTIQGDGFQPLEEGHPVSVDTKQSNEGLKAINVQIH